MAAAKDHDENYMSGEQARVEPPPPSYEEAVRLQDDSRGSDAGGGDASAEVPDRQAPACQRPPLFRAGSGKWQMKSRSSYDLAVNPPATLPVESPVQGSTHLQWPCSQCTFLNHHTMDRCEACELPRSVPPQEHDVQPSSDGPSAANARPPRVDDLQDAKLTRTTSEPSFGFSAALVSAPARAELVRMPEDRPTSIAQPVEPRPNYDTYISQEDEPLKNNDAEMARFLPTVSPEDVSVISAYEARTIPMRMNTETVMDTCLDDETDGTDVRRSSLMRAYDGVRRVSVERFSIQDVAVVEEGGERASNKASLLSRLLLNLKEPSKKLIIIAVFIIIALIVFLGVFPPSFVYLDYGYVALMKTKSTGYVNTKDVVYPGCHILGPDIELKIFNTAALTIDFQDVQSFIKDQMSISFSCNFQYFLRPETVGKLHDLYDMDFQPVIERIAFAALKTTTTQFTLENIRSNRSFVERHLHQDLQKKLGGDCCPICCAESCRHHPTCYRGCNSDRKTCNPGFHVDVRYFNFGAIVLPKEVTSRLLTIALSHVKAETEKFKQEYTMTEKATKEKVQTVLNEAAEIKNKADANGEYTVRIADANAVANRSVADIDGLQGLCSKLGITKMEHKLSVFMFKTFNGMDNLYMGPGWKNATTYAGPGYD